MLYCTWNADAAPRDARDRCGPWNWQRAAREGRALEPVDVAKTIVDVAADKKAADVTMIDIRELSVIADYFVICTGANRRQIQAIASAIDDKMGELHVSTRGREGNAEGGWVLLDYGDVIVHIFGPMEREFYRLERLWSEAPTVVYLQ
ncbi:MAG TPA: ribosome silencing factor [Ktedonobacterales bacterium]|jgi:ribosome-associated protein|nr:ribosome silencing factor [Ktedonobacterales bacterium]